MGTNNVFKLPIEYNNHKNLDKDIITNLDLLNPQDDNMPIFHYIFKPQTSLGELMLPKISQFFTTNTKYLKDTQVLLKKMNPDIFNKEQTFSLRLFNDSWNELKKETSFCEKYLYLDWEPIKFMNNNSQFLQIMSIYNLSSPLLSLLLPILLLIIPFIIIKLKGLPLNINEYINILKEIASNHALVKVFTNFEQVDNTHKIHSLLSVVFYVFSVYQSTLQSIRFYSNLNKIQEFFKCCFAFTDKTLEQMNWLSTHVSMKTYKSFIVDVNKNKEKIQYLHNRLAKLAPFSISFNTLVDLGEHLQLFYEINNDQSIRECIDYSLSLWGYLDNMSGLKTNLGEKKMNFCKFTKSKKNMSITSQYYPLFIEKTSTKNSSSLYNNMIITGPNASGKTTFLKTTLVNLILAQSVGCGCFEKATINPFDFFHCYLNIPDTSGRDSLFQAEARRCKEIIDSVNTNNKQSHFCIIDELYSGTNPDEATESACSFMKYLSKKKNIIVFLTTHYIKVCTNLQNNQKIKNFHMKTTQTKDNIEFLYTLEPGISSIKGGKFILHSMNYPKEIVDSASSLSKKKDIDR